LNCIIEHQQQKHYNVRLIIAGLHNVRHLTSCAHNTSAPYFRFLSMGTGEIYMGIQSNLGYLFEKGVTLLVMQCPQHWFWQWISFFFCLKWTLFRKKAFAEQLHKSCSDA